MSEQRERQRPGTGNRTILRRCRAEHIQGVITTDDYPGTTVASVVAHELNLPSPKPEANLFCQHKFYSRQIQALAAPEATPDFQLIDVRPEAAMPPGRSFPLFVKPVKSFFSVGAQPVESRSDLEKINNRWARSAAFFHPFEILFHKYTGHFLGTNYLLGEGLLQGIQTTLDGYVCAGQVHVMGVVDSVMFPNTIAFQRFEYPSSVPAPVQDRMAAHRKRRAGHESGPGSQDREIFADRRQNAGICRRRGSEASGRDREIHAHRPPRSRSAWGPCLHFRPDRRRCEPEGRRLLSLLETVFTPL
jgi:hypothetical protein